MDASTDDASGSSPITIVPSKRVNDPRTFFTMVGYSSASDGSACEQDPVLVATYDKALAGLAVETSLAAWKTLWVSP